MYPQCPLPGHITALYLIAVTSCVALFSHSVHFVGADIFVYSLEYRGEIENEFHDMPAHFGNSLPFEGLKGLLVDANPSAACEHIEPPPRLPPPFDSFKWIVLIRRYDCSFEEKVRWAQKANYSAAIVHNVNSSELEPMSAKTASDIFIPSVFVSELTGQMLRINYTYNVSDPNNSFYIIINDDQPFNINTHLLLPFGIVVGICFVVMLVFMIVKCIKDRRRQRRHRLPYSSLRKIATAKFAKGDPYETCAICLEDYQEGEKLRILPCSHAYHTKCIDPWLTRNRRVCPVCKRKVFAQDEHVSDSDSDSESEDTAPLVRSSASHTQGGTFVPQTENPFVTANRSGLSSSLFSVSSAGSSSVMPEGSNVSAATEAECINVTNEHSINSVPGTLGMVVPAELAVEVNPVVNTGEQQQDLVV